MSRVAHQLHEEFLDKVETSKALKDENAHFADRRRLSCPPSLIHRMETEVAPTDDSTHESLKKLRPSLEDELAQFLLTA